jgi:hypothetical protein
MPKTYDETENLIRQVLDSINPGSKPNFSELARQYEVPKSYTYDGNFSLPHNKSAAITTILINRNRSHTGNILPYAYYHEDAPIH